MVEKTRRQQLEKALALVQEELKACEEELADTKKKLASAEAMSVRILQVSRVI